MEWLLLRTARAAMSVHRAQTKPAIHAAVSGCLARVMGICQPGSVIVMNRWNIAGVEIVPGVRPCKSATYPSRWHHGEVSMYPYAKRGPASAGRYAVPHLS